MDPPEEFKILLGFIIGCIAYIGIDILTELFNKYPWERKYYSDDAKQKIRFSFRKHFNLSKERRRAVLLVFYFSGGVSCLFIGKYLLGTIFIIISLVIKSVYKGYKNS